MGWIKLNYTVNQQFITTLKLGLIKHLVQPQLIRQKLRRSKQRTRKFFCMEYIVQQPRNSKQVSDL